MTGSASHHRPDRPAARPRTPDPRRDAGDRTLAARPMAGARGAVLRLGGPAQQPASSWRRWTPTCFPAASTTSIPEFQPLCVQAAMAAIEKICPDARGVAADPGEPHPQHVLPAERRDAAADPAPGRHERAHRQPAAGDHRAHAISNCPTARRCTLEPLAAQRQPRSGSTDFDPCVVLLNNDLSAGVPDILREPRADAAAAAARRLGHAPQVEPLRRLPRGRRGIRAS